MPKQTSLKKRLQKGEQLTGCFLSLFNPIAAEIIARTGYDIALIDMEHGPGSHLDTISIMQAIQSTNCQAVIRTTSSDSAEIKRTMDIGPAGIMVPNVCSAIEAKQIVAHTRYAPRGDRGAAPGFVRATHYGRTLKDYNNFLKKDFLLIAQIESAEALGELGEILNTDGIDMIFIGPADLSASLGKLGDFTSKQFKQAFKQIETKTLATNKPLGTLVFNQWTAKKLYNTGHQLVIANADTLLLAQAADKDLKALKQSMY